MRICRIEEKDNQAINQIIKAVFPEFGLPLKGTAYEDVETTKMYQSFSDEGAAYFVLRDDNGIVRGGGGIKQLVGVKDSICELQKMYFSPEVRGRGYGKKMLLRCLEEAKTNGFEYCYLESASQLKAAIHLYEKNGFKYLPKALGETGHYSCGVWMLKKL